MAEERVQRRLAAIMIADVVGYGRLMGTDADQLFESKSLGPHRRNVLLLPTTKQEARIAASLHFSRNLTGSDWADCPVSACRIPNLTA